jgi:hypothetical protein
MRQSAKASVRSQACKRSSLPPTRCEWARVFIARQLACQTPARPASCRPFPDTIHPVTARSPGPTKGNGDPSRDPVVPQGSRHGLRPALQLAFVMSLFPLVVPSNDPVGKRELGHIRFVGVAARLFFLGGTGGRQASWGPLTAEASISARTLPPPKSANRWRCYRQDHYPITHDRR